MPVSHFYIPPENFEFFVSIQLKSGKKFYERTDAGFFSAGFRKCFLSHFLELSENEAQKD
jgi:hypothetical protein